VTRIFHIIRIAFPLLALACTFWVCNGVDSGDLSDADLDARLDAGPEASLMDVVVPDVLDVMVTVADARPDTAWCGENPFPGVDLNAQALTPDPPGIMMTHFSWDGSQIVYSRSDPGPIVPGMDYEVYRFDMDTWQEMPTTELPDSYQFSPTIHSGQVIWSDGRYRTIGIDDSRFELVAYDIGTGLETRLTDSSDGKATPRSNGRYVAYDFMVEGTGTIALHFLDLVTLEATELCPASQGPEGVSISDRYVTWVAWPPNSQFTDKDVFIHDLQTHQTQHLQSTSGSSTFSTSVSGSKVVWMDFRHGQWDIYLYDIEADQETRLTDDPFDQVAPMIHGNLVTMSDFRFTLGYFYGYCARDIFILDIDTMIGRRVTNLPWSWWGRPGANGWLLAVLRDEPSLQAPAKLYLFDLIGMGIFDPTGQHVLSGP